MKPTRQVSNVTKGSDEVRKPLAGAGEPTRTPRLSNVNARNSRDRPCDARDTELTAVFVSVEWQWKMGVEYDDHSTPIVVGVYGFGFTCRVL